MNTQQSTRRTLFLTIVRCHLGYASQVWSPQSIGLLKQVEGIQQRATKYILKLPFRCDIPYKTGQASDDQLNSTVLLARVSGHCFLL